MTETTMARTALTQISRRLVMLNMIQLICGVGFAIDLYQEFPALWALRYRSWDGVLHMGLECAMMGLLFVGFAMARGGLRALNMQRDLLERKLSALRGDFDRILKEHFDRWALTPAQRDVALLTLRGLRLSEIAQHRGNAEGTIKAHLGAVFRAAGVRTRAELVGIFMEDFLDFAAVPIPRNP